ncbi:MAG: MBL fold metallo-hydrolase [Nanoarchaeota archaeon]|nr:MBL fold metallo-hydrolase [Nanoarchaeota archaeon]
MIKPITENLWQFSFSMFGSCVYVLKLNGENILIDTSTSTNKQEILDDLKKLKIKPENINIILLTHNHFDHIENINLFPNAKVYGDNNDFQKDHRTKDNILDIQKMPIKGLEIIKTPGHTPGSICLYMPREQILFSGDTLFHKGVGRTDFPESSKKDLNQSIEKLEEIQIKTLCPGHI